MHDVVVLGAGPAGLAMAAEVAKRGARVLGVAPSPRTPWRSRFGGWLDELGTASECLRRVWHEPLVWLDHMTCKQLDQRYGLVDNQALQDRLQTAFSGGGGRWVEGSATQVQVLTNHSIVELSDGRRLRARVVVDATGARSHFVSRPAQRCGYQTAFGQLIGVRRHGFAPGQMTLMDFRGLGAVASGEPPTFLYAMPLSSTELFVEETVLVARKPVSFENLRLRLRRRLHCMGLEVREVVDEERCVIPMGVGVPYGQRTVAFGAAGALVHPATGYQLGRALHLAGPVAAALVAGLSVSSAEASRRAYQAMWPSAARRAWDMFAFGMGVTCSFDAERMRAFMTAFFALPSKNWCRYMSGTATPAEIASAMSKVFLAADAGLRRDLLGAAFSRDATPLWRGLVTGGLR